MWVRFLHSDGDGGGRQGDYFDWDTEGAGGLLRLGHRGQGDYLDWDTEGAGGLLGQGHTQGHGDNLGRGIT